MQFCTSPLDKIYLWKEGVALIPVVFANIVLKCCKTGEYTTESGKSNILQIEVPEIAFEQFLKPLSWRGKLEIATWEGKMDICIAI